MHTYKYPMAEANVASGASQHSGTSVPPSILEALNKRKAAESKVKFCSVCLRGGVLVRFVVFLVRLCMYVYMYNEHADAYKFISMFWGYHDALILLVRFEVSCLSVHVCIHV